MSSSSNESSSASSSSESSSSEFSSSEFEELIKCPETTNRVIEKLQTDNYKFSFIKFFRKIFKDDLIKLKNDFFDLRGETIRKMQKMCENNQYRELEEFLSLNPWAKELLSGFFGDRFVDESFEKKMFDVLVVVLKNDPSARRYKYDILNSSIAHKYQDLTEKLLYSGSYSKEEVKNAIIKRDSYFCSTREIVSMITNFFQNSEYEILANRHNGFFLYKKELYEDASDMFSKIMNQERNPKKQIDGYYYGLCLMFLDKTTEAMNIFKTITKSDSAEKFDYWSTVKEHAQKRIDVLEKKCIETLKTINFSIWDDNDLLQPHKKNISVQIESLIYSIEDPRGKNLLIKKISEAIVSELFNINYGLKNNVSKECILADEFSHIPELYNSSGQKREYFMFCQARNDLRDKIKLLKDTFLIDEDVFDFDL